MSSTKKQAKATYGEETITTAAGREFSIDYDYGHISLMSTDFLAAVARGEVDMNELAKRTLANRGYGPNCEWLGFEGARQALGVERDVPSGNKRAFWRD
jgi:hypothetical protein